MIKKPSLIPNQTLLDYLQSNQNTLLYEWDLLNYFYPEYKKKSQSFNGEKLELLLFYYHFTLYHSLHKLDSILEYHNNGKRIGISLSFIKLVEKDEKQCSFFHSHDHVFCHYPSKQNSRYCELHANRTTNQLPESQNMRSYYYHYININKVNAQDINYIMKNFYFFLENQNDLENACKMLEVTLDSSLHQIKQKYYEKVKLYHPDISPDTGQEKMKALNRAYSTLIYFNGMKAKF